MFKKSMSKKSMSKKHKAGNREVKVIDSVIGGSTRVMGNIKGPKDIRIDGMVEGNIEIEGQIIVGETAIIKGDIKAEVVTIYGKVKGDVKSIELLEIMETGELRGDVETLEVMIKRGGKFVGESRMLKEDEFEPPEWVEEDEESIGTMNIVEKIPV